MTKKAPSFKSTATALLMPWLLVQVAQAVGQEPRGISTRDSGGCPPDTGGCGGAAPSTDNTLPSVNPQETTPSHSSDNLWLGSPDGSSQSVAPPQITGSTTGSTTRPNGGPKNVPAIVGGVVGGVAFLALLGALLLFFLRRRSDSDAEGNYQSGIVLDKTRTD